MTKLIAALMVLAVLYGGWQLFFYWEKVKNEEETQKKQTVSSVIDPEGLSGLPQSLQPVLRGAEAQGALGLRTFLKNYGRSIQDPRKAWIELDLCLLVAREDPAEAKRVFNQVKDRTPETSPIWPRIKKLEKAFE
jgi:hypothetical protein